MPAIRSALVGALLVLGVAVTATAQQATPGQHKRGGRGGPEYGQRALLKGITLSDAEKANLKAVDAKYASQMKALRTQNKPQLQAARDARQRGDTAALRQIWQNGAAERAQSTTLMQAERNDERAALTPANQTLFDANAKKFDTRATKRAGRAWNKRGPGAVG